MRHAAAFAVGAAVIWMYQNHPDEFWFVIKAVCCGFVVLWFFQRRS